MKIKSLAAGFIAGVLTMGTITVFGLTLGNGRVEAYLQDNNVSIMLDGKRITLSEDAHIINYDGRIYTPARLVAESLGAEVEWQEATRSVVMTSPEPKVVEKIKEVVVEKEVYNKLPIRRAKDEMTIEVMDYYQRKNYIDFKFDFNYEGSKAAFLKLQNAYVEIDGERYDYYSISMRELEVQSIPTSEKVKDVTISFDGVPEKSERAKLVIPIEYGVGDDEKQIFKFEFNIELD